MDSPAVGSTVKQYSGSLSRTSNNHQDEKSARILALLRSKDDALMQLQAKYEEERNKTSELQAELSKQVHGLAEAEEKIKNVQERFQEHKRTAASVKESDAQKIRDLEAQLQNVEEETQEVMCRVTELEESQKELMSQVDSTRELQEHVATLTSALEAADEIIGNLHKAVDQGKETSAIKDNEIEVLREQLVSLIGEDNLVQKPNDRSMMEVDGALYRPSADGDDDQLDVQRLLEKVEDLERRLEDETNMKLSVKERCNELENLLHEEQVASKHVQSNLEMLQQQTQASSTKFEGLLQECSTLKDHLLEAQQENDSLKSTIWDLEKQCAKQTATLVAQEAANNLQSQWRLSGFQTFSDCAVKNASKTSPAYEELSNQIQSMALNTIDLQRQLEEAEAKLVINHRQMEHLHRSLERYRLLGDQISSSPPYIHEISDETDGVEELYEMIHSLRERLVHSAAAQEGQAKAFTALVKEITGREAILQRKLQDTSKVQEHLRSLQLLCSKTIGMMHGTIARMAMEEGDKEEANALLHGSTHWSLLGETTAELLRRFQSLSDAFKAFQTKQSTEPNGVVGNTLSIADRSSTEVGQMTGEVVFLDQLDSILQLAEEICSFLSFEDLTKSQPREIPGNNASIASFVGERAQLIFEMAKTLKLSIKALKTHYAGKPVMKHTDEERERHMLSGKTQNSQQDTIEDLVRQIATLNERASLMSAAHEAALEEASHYQEAVEHLKLAQVNYQRQEEGWKKEIERLKDLLKGFESITRSEDHATRLNTTNSISDEVDKVDKGDKVNKVKDTTAEELVALLDGLDVLLADAARMEERLLTLEASLAAAERLQKENQVATNYGRLVSGALRAKQVAEVWKDCQEKLNALHKIIAQKDKLVHDVNEEKNTLLDKVKALELQHKSQEDRHSQEIKAVVARAEEDRQKLQTEITEAVTSATASDVEKRLIGQFEQSIAILKKGLEAARAQCAELRSQKDAIYSEFVRYKEIKQAEIGLLEERLGFVGDEASQENIFTSDDERTNSLENEIARACNADAVSAALREAKLERMYRKKIEEMLKLAMVSDEESKIRPIGLDATKVSDIFDSKNILSFRRV